MDYLRTGLKDQNEDLVGKVSLSDIARILKVTPHKLKCLRRFQPLSLSPEAQHRRNTRRFEEEHL